MQPKENLVWFLGILLLLKYGESHLEEEGMYV
jgi:hypothetical protein